MSVALGNYQMKHIADNTRLSHLLIQKLIYCHSVSHAPGVESASRDSVSTHVAPRCSPPPQRGCFSVSGTTDDSGKLSYLCNMGSRVRWDSSWPSQTRHFPQSRSHKRWDTGEIAHTTRYIACCIVIIQLTGYFRRCGCPLKGAWCKRS